MSDPALHAFHRRVLLVALLVHTITAWFSSGYYAADEHYQVIAFAQHKLGELPANELPWEYDARIRSAILPSIAYGAIVGCRAALTAKPMHIAFILRLATALVALMVVRTFIRSTLPGVQQKLQRPFVLLSYFLWFLPYQHVRFSTETCAGLLLLLGLAQLIGNTERTRAWLVAGICFGVCIQVRPAMGLACAGAVGWFLFASDTRGRSFIRLAAGGLFALVLGVALDSWFYGEPMHTLWNYVYKNSLSIAKVQPLPVASETYPWWYYFPWIVKYGIWPIGLLLLSALLWITWRKPDTWLVWCIWPYLLLVSLIPHKELRFLFPMVDLCPLVLVSAWQEAAATPSLSRMRKGTGGTLKWSLVALVLVNATGLITAGLTAAGSGRIRLAERMIAIHPSDPMTLGYTLKEPLIWEVRVPSFYLFGDFLDVGTFDPCDASGLSATAAAPQLLIAPEDDGQGSGCTVMKTGYRPFARSEPSWTTQILDLYNSERNGPYMLYRRQPPGAR